MKVLPNLPNFIDLTKLKIENNKLIYPPFLDNTTINFIKNINFINKLNHGNNQEINLEKILNRMKLLNKELLLEHSQNINLSSKRIKRLIKNKEFTYYNCDIIEI